ncbi:MAG: succinate dehydrogenase cytochrome b subunit [Anaerolineales bacterium]|nr:succinate dehydrogenase cytochrome b subunit [Anaerolineales bacterium]
MTLPKTSIGKKVIMALTGVIWIGFIAMHMWGNLHIFQGPESFNHYAEWLREVGEPVFSYGQVLWLLRIVTVTAILLHMWSAFSLYSQARKAHGSSYAVKRVLKANYASRFMRIGGVLIILFIIFHLAQFTWTALPNTVLTPRYGPYNNVVTAFSNPLISGFYILVLAVLGLHLFHGVWSMFQTVGLNNRDWDGFFRGLAWLTAILIPLGFMLVPLAVLFGFLKPV